MDNPSTHNVTCRTDAKNAHAHPSEAFSPVEMMMVVTLIPRLRGGQVLIIASIATPMEALSSQPSVISEHAEN